MNSQLTQTKKVVGIELDEIIRAKWAQFDKYYVEEFGEENIPEDCYSYDYLSTYKWGDTVEKNKYLKEPENFPDDIHPKHYQVDPETGEIDADYILFDPEEVVELSSVEVYNRFLFEDYVFEIHASARPLYGNIELDINKLIKKFESDAEFVLVSKENFATIPPTLFFLSKVMSRFKKYLFVDNDNDLWKDVDVLVTTNPEAIKLKPENKKLVIIKRPYNIELNSSDISEDIIQLKDLVTSKDFENLITNK